jgi:hypothetical protein
MGSARRLARQRRNAPIVKLDVTWLACFYLKQAVVGGTGFAFPKSGALAGVGKYGKVDYALLMNVAGLLPGCDREGTFARFDAEVRSEV